MSNLFKALPRQTKIELAPMTKLYVQTNGSNAFVCARIQCTVECVCIFVFFFFCFICVVFIRESTMHLLFAQIKTCGQNYNLNTHF